jgi:hypothetical protein
VVGVIRYLSAALKAINRRGNLWAGDDTDLARTWDAVDETTGSVSTFRNIYEVRSCVLRRYNHAAAEGAEYRGVQS